ncbi:MAG: SpaA isopeptide-forming pilin-related protein [Ruminococcus sp.]
MVLCKTDVKGSVMKGCEMTLTGPGGYSKTWTSDADPETLTGLAEGEYTLTEKPMTGYDR